MKIINTKQITAVLKTLISKACTQIDTDTQKALKNACLSETSSNAAFALDILCKNIDDAKNYNIPACQDTGMAVVYLEIGQDVAIQGDYIEDAINLAVREAYRENFFRMSVLDPITRKNTGDNTPAIIHTRIVKGDTLKITFLAKGFGSENMSKLFMLKPADGLDGIIDCIVETVKLGGSNPCPPIVVGVGIGGTADKAMEMSKYSLLRQVGSVNPCPELDKLENSLLSKINQLGIGAQGFGGKNTALAVHIEKFPTHLAGLPVGINIQCHCIRVRSAVL